METNSRPRVLLVDDDPNILDAHRRNLRGLYEMMTAPDGDSALQILERETPVSAIVTDLRMPQMNGIALLHRVREIAPDTVRVLFTGQPDLQNAIAAVNEGAIFRFLTKPCPPELLRKTLEAAVEQHRLVTVERSLLEQTLKGSVQAVTEILALANPAAFGRAVRARASVATLIDHFKITDRWAVEVAAMLSQIGCVALPPATVEKLHQGRPLTPEEREMVARLPGVVEELLAKIPRLEQVRQILRYQNKNYDGSGLPHDGAREEKLPWGARALKIVLDLDILEALQSPLPLAFDTLRGRSGCYDPAILDALAGIRCGPATESSAVVKELAVSGLEAGMIFAEDVKTSKGLLLVARGQEVTPSLTERIHNFSRAMQVREPIRVIVPASRKL